MRVWPPPWSTAFCTTARSFTSRDLRFDSKVGLWKAKWSPRQLRPPTAAIVDSRLSTALVDQRTQCVEHISNRCCSEHHPARRTDRLRTRRASAMDLLADIADGGSPVTPATQTPIREGSR